MNHKEIMQKIGELFLLRTNINSVGSVLDSPVRVQLSSCSPVHRPPADLVPFYPRRKCSGYVFSLRPQPLAD